jgi:hypothetical protein
MRCADSLSSPKLRNFGLAKEGASVAPPRATPTACLQELCEWRSRSSISSAFRDVSRDVARARECPPVPKCTRLVPARRPNFADAGNIIALFAGLLRKPSDGLEPSTPSLPWRFWGGTRVHGRASKIAFDLQIAALRRVTRVLAYPRVVDLMYPSRTRVLLSVLKTYNADC